MRFNKPCLDCGQLSRNNRCENCQTIHNKKRNEREASGGYRATRKAALYGSTYRKEAKLIRETATTCHLCGEGARVNDPFQADHIIPSDKSYEEALTLDWTISQTMFKQVINALQ